MNVMSKLRFIIRNCNMAIKSLFWEKDPSVIVLGSWFGERYADNSRVLYQYLSDNKEILNLSHVIWVSREQKIIEELKESGYEAYLLDSKESIFWHKVARFHIICNMADSFGTGKSDILSSYSWRAVRINLWHGVLAFKGVGRASNEYITSHNSRSIKNGIKELLHQNAIMRKLVEQPGGWGDCYYVSSSKRNTEDFKLFFELPDQCFIEAGSPRNSQHIINYTSYEQEIIGIIESYKKTIIYVPTFRTGNSSFDFNEISKRLNNYFIEKGYLFIQKAHSADSSVIDNLKRSNILNLPSDFDINVLIPKIDVLITDYSTAAGDAMFFYKPLVFYVPDYDEYLKGDRGFIRNPEEIMCGSVAKNIEELKCCLEKTLCSEFHPDKKYNKIRNEYFGDDKKIEEIWNTISNVLG